MVLRVADEERWELYRVLDVRGKLENGQAYLRHKRLMTGPPKGDWPPGTRGRMVDILLTVNDWKLCVANQFVDADGVELTEPDPKYIQIDDVAFKQPIPSFS